ncbi:MAG: hypothetical protein QOJ15_10080 [Bradyrhizobium sp.]|nr:hypothetical protein [Bradyrhizobium sp.]
MFGALLVRVEPTATRPVVTSGLPMSAFPQKRRLTATTLLRRDGPETSAVCPRLLSDIKVKTCAPEEYKAANEVSQKENSAQPGLQGGCAGTCGSISDPIGHT